MNKKYIFFILLSIWSFSVSAAKGFSNTDKEKSDILQVGKSAIRTLLAWTRMEFKLVPDDFYHKNPYDIKVKRIFFEIEFYNSESAKSIFEELLEQEVPEQFISQIGNSVLINGVSTLIQGNQQFMSAKELLLNWVFDKKKVRTFILEHLRL